MLHEAEILIFLSFLQQFVCLPRQRFRKTSFISIEMELSEAIEKPRINDVIIRKVGPNSLFPYDRDLCGSVAITGHHFIFQPASDGQNGTFTELSLLHKSIDHCLAEPKSKERPELGAILTLRCKNFLVCVFEVKKPSDAYCVAKSVSILSNLVFPAFTGQSSVSLDDIRLDYAFFYRCTFPILEDGHTAFSLHQEFARLQLLCDSYPEAVIVPKNCTDEMLKASAAFRDGGRFLTLAYFHRDSRPLVGPGERRCREDEQLLNSLLFSSSTVKAYIIDTRTTQLAQTAKTKGGGSEVEMWYPRWKRAHRALPQQGQLKDALSRLIEACHDEGVSGGGGWLSRLAASGWPTAVSDVLSCAAVVAQCVDREGETKETPVVVHGGAGRDGTLQVTSLAALILDPDARTIRGFESLIQREWLYGGHPFRWRCAHGAYASGQVTGPHEAPTFLCFLDCVWQIYQQYPCSFEFTEELLLFLADDSFASDFGTFLANSEKEREKNDVKTTTISVWSYLNQPQVLQSFVNPLYEPMESPVWPSIAPQSLHLWERLYLRWTRDWTEEDECRKAICKWKQQERELIGRVMRCKRQLLEADKEAQLRNV